MKKKFEVPYNFDEKLITFYIKHDSRINFLYIPPFKDDLINTRTSIQTNTKGHCYMPESRKEYEYHLQKINSAGLRFVILWQVSDSIISKELLDYYTGLKTSGFIVANDANASIIKNFDCNLLVICSLVQRLKENIAKRDFRYYDYIILYYTFNRSLDALKKLEHLKNKIILMPNTLCNIDCPSIHHWFPTKKRPFDPKKDCWVSLERMDKCGFIFPEHLHYFDNFIGGYKLQGREYPTDAIKYLCHFYFEGAYYKNFVDPFLSDDMAKKLYNLAHNEPAEDYYNSHTSKTLDNL